MDTKRNILFYSFLGPLSDKFAGAIGKGPDIGPTVGGVGPIVGGVGPIIGGAGPIVGGVGPIVGGVGPIAGGAGPGFGGFGPGPVDFGAPVDFGFGYLEDDATSA
jgi:U1 small nuclear ribonucleoprotein C